MSSKRSYLFKVLTSGDGGVGKTTLLHRYIEGKFLPNTLMTLGVEFFTKELIIDDFDIVLQLWDFGGQSQFRFMLERYSMGAKGALILFDLTRYITFENVEEWVHICTKHNPGLPIILVGSKLDLAEEIVIKDDIVEEVKEQFNFLDYIKVSSKTGENVEEIFKKLAKIVVERELY